MSFLTFFRYFFRQVLCCPLIDTRPWGKFWNLKSIVVIESNSERVKVEVFELEVRIGGMNILHSFVRDIVKLRQPENAVGGVYRSPFPL